MKRKAAPKKKRRILRLPAASRLIEGALLFPDDVIESENADYVFAKKAKKIFAYSLSGGVSYELKLVAKKTFPQNHKLRVKSLPLTTAAGTLLLGVHDGRTIYVYQIIKPLNSA